MKSGYFLILPNIYLQKPCSIGKATFRRFGSDQDAPEAGKDDDVLKSIQQMLFNTGFSGLFTYWYFESVEPFQDIILDMRKIMTIFRYVVFETHPDYGLESLTYYLLQPRKFADEVAEMEYSLDGVQDGNRMVHFWAPGSKEVTRRANYPQILTLEDGHYLIQLFNASDLEDKYIIAMERFERIFKENHDPVEDIQNLITAFEHVFKPEKVDRADLFAKQIIEAFGLNGTALAGVVTEWCEEFYRVRGQILHGNAFRHYTSTRGFDYWEECFKWKHPNGKIRYRPHAHIASKIFQLLVRRLLGGREKLEIKQLEQMLTESELEPLITPNEVHYRKLKELVDKGEPFGNDYVDLVSKIRHRDGTEEKTVLLELLVYFLTVTENRFSDLQGECHAIANSIATEEIVTIGLRAVKLSQKIKRKVTDDLVINDETVKYLCLMEFFEKAHFALTHIALAERGVKQSAR